MKLNAGKGPIPTTSLETPKDVAELVVGSSQKKAESSTASLIVLGILAGAYIAFGGELYTVAIADLANYIGDGFSRIFGGAVFSLGLILVVVGGAELFTGNSLMVTGVLERRITGTQLLRNWVIVYFSNFVGALILVALFYFSGLWRVGGTGLKAVGIANAKVSLSWGEAIARGILCNWLVCLAVWLATAGRDSVSKIAGIVFPIMAFVASGFEHSIANMYFVPLGIALKSNPVMAEILQSAGVTNLGNLAWGTFIMNNLIPVTIGNIIGGAFFVGTAYWSVFLRSKPAESADLGGGIKSR